MVSELPQLEVLEMLEETASTLWLQDAMPLSQLPKLRRVHLSGPFLWAGNPQYHGLQHDHLPSHVAEQLLELQKAAPQIEWVLRNDPKLSLWEYP